MAKLLNIGFLILAVALIQGCSSDAASIGAAADVTYNNNSSGLAATNVQEGIDEVANPICPSGMVKASRHVCVDQALNNSGNTFSFSDANDNCIADGQRLCYPYELITPCSQGDITDHDTPAGNYEWTANVIAGNVAVIALGDDCTTTSSAAYATVRQYRCGKEVSKIFLKVPVYF